MLIEKREVNLLMKIEGWRYYNHAALPATAPYEVPNLKVIEDGSIWKIDGKPLLAQWISDWDCSQETEWWYMICESPFNINDLSRSARKNIRKAMKNCEVRIINPEEYIDELYQVFMEATKRYKYYNNTLTKKSFQRRVGSEENVEYWAGFDRKSGRMIGYKVCRIHDTYVEFSVSKYSSDYLYLRVSDALNAEAIAHYLNLKGKRFITNGSRSILHKTNVQTYYQEHFNFRKAYCRLHILYRPFLKVAVSILYPIRKMIPDIKRLHCVIALLNLEEIARNQLEQ